MQFKMNETVKVKPGVRCPDLETLDISDWQGRIFEVDEDNAVVGVRWDSVTLEQMPADYIQKSEEEGLGWTEMYLSVDELESTFPRDSATQARKVRDQMESKCGWLGMGKEGQRIFMIVGNAEPGDELAAWDVYLRRILVFPFDAIVEEPHDLSVIKCGEKVQVRVFTDTDDEHGMLVHVIHENERHILPLCDLSPLDKKSPNYTPVRDYCVWYANR